MSWTAEILDLNQSIQTSTERLAEQKKANSSIGTSAMGMGKARGSAAAPPAAKKNDEWDDW